MINGRPRCLPSLNSDTFPHMLDCQERDGGSLRLLLSSDRRDVKALQGGSGGGGGGGGVTPLDIAPLGGRMVLFDSRRIAHEVSHGQKPHVARKALMYDPMRLSLLSNLS